MFYARSLINAAKWPAWLLWCISLSPLLALSMLYMLGPGFQRPQQSRFAQTPTFFDVKSWKNSGIISQRSLYHWSTRSEDARETGGATARWSSGTTPGRNSKGSVDSAWASLKQYANNLRTVQAPSASHIDDQAKPSIGSASADGQVAVEQTESQGLDVVPPPVMHQVGKLTYDDRPQCPGVPDVQPEQLPPVDPRVNFLMILGAQKAGTTWLFDALDTHPLFNGANHGFRRPLNDPWRKEVHFFDRLPTGSTQQYMSCFPAQPYEEALQGRPNVFVDATPAYLYTPAAAPRIKQAIPHAKFVIVLRDPAERLYSSWKMMNRQPCTGAGQNGTTPKCAVPSLADLTQGILPSTAVKPGCSPADASGTHAWGDCWPCSYAVIARDECKAHGGSDEVCERLRGVPVAHVSYYAPQIAWWLSFFPPERFLVFTSQQLHDPQQQLDVLNRIREHVGLSGAPAFTHDQIAGIQGFVGGYSADMAAEDSAALAVARAAFDAAAPSLQRLMDVHLPDQGFHGFGET